jgi:4'-phosphopantetheinyl transferase
MPLIFDKKEAAFSLGIWRMDEEPDEMLKTGIISSKDAERVHSFQSSARRKEWICTRLLLAGLMPAMNLSIEYDDKGKPHLRNSISDKEVQQFHISVSHTKNYVAVIVSEKYPVAIDIELLHPRIEKIAYKFISDEEMKYLPADNPLQQYYLIWSAKECLFKMHGRGEMLFKEHLFVHPFEFSPDKGEMTATIRKDNLLKTYSLNYQFYDELLLVYSLAKEANE